VDHFGDPKWITPKAPLKAQGTVRYAMAAATKTPKPASHTATRLKPTGADARRGRRRSPAQDAETIGPAREIVPRAARGSMTQRSGAPTMD
jgi:hypothetical protein